MRSLSFSRVWSVAALGVLVSALGCTNDKALTGQSVATGTFLQIARMGRPLVVELFTPWADHDFILRSGPQADLCAGKLCADIGSFVSTSPAGRSAAITTFVQNVFADPAAVPPSTFPTESNVLVADISQNNASFLGVELGDRVTASGQVNPSPTASFGGRGLPDDVAAIELGLTFGNLVPAIDSSIPDDGNEKDGRNGTPNLANDNVTSLTQPNPKHYQIGFPYAPLAFPYLGTAR
jgi:hypothetical protein